MSHIFLSYSSSDVEQARRLAEALASDGFEVWWDRAIPTGADYARLIREKLTTARAVVVLWSLASTRSKWVCAEAQLADDNGRLCPAMIEAVDLPLPFNRLETALIQDWKGARDDSEYLQLVGSLKRLGSEGEPVPMPFDEALTAGLVEEAQCGSGDKEFAPTLETLSNFAARLGARGSADDTLTALSVFASQLSRAIRDFPERSFELHDFIFDWYSSAEAWAASHPSDSAGRTLEEHRRVLRRSLDDAARQGRAEDFDWPTPLPWLVDLGSWSADVARKRFNSKDELVRLDAAEALAEQPMESMRRLLDSLSDAEEREQVHDAIWDAWPQLRLHHPPGRATLAQLLMRDAHETWERRLATFRMLETMETADEVDLILARAAPKDRTIFFETLLDHPALSCRKFALDQLPAEKRWTTLVHPKTHIVIVREIAARSIEDCESGFIKGMFLLLYPRLAEETTTIGIREAYRLVSIFAGSPVFLENAFFEKLVDLRKVLRRRVEQKSALRHLEDASEEYFQSFLTRGRLKDADITRLTHVPAAIQRLLAHEGHFPKYFICNYRDVVALETVPHVQKRPDFVDFLKLRRVNGNALEELASNKLIMREYINKLTFCRHPKAKAKQLMEHMRLLRRTDLRALSRDKNASTFAREQASRMVTRSV